MIDPEVGEVVGGRLVQMTLLGQPLASQQAPKCKGASVSDGFGISCKKIESGDFFVTNRIVSKYESLHHLTTGIRFRVERSLHCCYVWGVPWSLQLQKFQDAIEFWTRVVKLRKDVCSSRTALRRLGRKKLDLLPGYHTSFLSAIQELRQAYSFYSKSKEDAPSWHDSHNQNLVDALVLEGKPQNQHADRIRAHIHRE